MRKWTIWIWRYGVRGIKQWNGVLSCMTKRSVWLQKDWSVSTSRVETVSKVQIRHHHESAAQIQFSVHSTKTLHGASTVTICGLNQEGIQSGNSGQVLWKVHSQSYAWSETTCSQTAVCQEAIDSLSPCSCRNTSNGWCSLVHLSWSMRGEARYQSGMQIVVIIERSLLMQPVGFRKLSDALVNKESCTAQNAAWWIKRSVLP